MILQLHKELDAKKLLELERDRLKGQLQVMDHMQCDDDIKLEKKIVRYSRV
jgi:hypothetical protein